jgi:hypothetical protein
MPTTSPFSSTASAPAPTQGAVHVGVLAAGERDQAEARVILAQPRDRCDAVEEGHVEVDDGSVRAVGVHGLDRLDSVAGDGDDAQLRLPVDELTERREEAFIVVREEDVDRPLVQVEVALPKWLLSKRYDRSP